MGVLLDLLTTEKIGLPSPMYFGTDRLRDIVFFVQGAEWALSTAAPEAPGDLDGFREWLVVEFDGPCNVSWPGQLLTALGSDAPAHRFFEYVNRFLEDVAIRGLPAILDQHRAYEIKRYGTPVTARRS